LIYPFQRLGIKNIVPVSAAQNWQIAELLETVFKDFPRGELTEETTIGTKVAIVGRPNVGKSSLVNYFLDEERCIVSPIPGTTRDSIDISFTHEDEQYTLIDTAGIRRKRAEHETVDKFAAIRTARAIERADVCLLMVDAQEGITVQEKKIASLIEEAGKGCIVLFNKWDLVKGFRMEHCLKSVDESIPFLRYCPKLMISAVTGRNIDKIFGVIKEVREASTMRITTHQLNKFLEAAIQKNHPPMIMGKRLRIYYMAQVDVQPPRFVLFVNYPNLMVDSYQKYLYNQFRETYEFTGMPILMHLKGKKRVEGERHQRAAQHDAEEEIDLSSDQDEDTGYQSEDSDDDGGNGYSQGYQSGQDEEDS
jgi:GTP-binding protein